jgi:hypothetical protein
MEKEENEEKILEKFQESYKTIEFENDYSKLKTNEEQENRPLIILPNNHILFETFIKNEEDNKKITDFLITISGNN